MERNEQLDVDLRYGKQTEQYRSRPARLRRTLRQLGAVGVYVRPPLPNSQPVMVRGSVAGTHATRYQVEQYLPRRKGPQGTDAALFGTSAAPLDLERFVRMSQNDPHQFRFIVSPQHGHADMMQEYITALMAQMRDDLRRPLDWVAAIHQDTPHVHAHVLVRGRDFHGKDLYIQRPYLREGLRFRAQALATRMLGVAQETTKGQHQGRALFRGVARQPEGLDR